MLAGAAWLLTAGWQRPAGAGEGILDTIRQDVRSVAERVPSPPSPEKDHDHCGDHSPSPDDGVDLSVFFGFVWLGGAAVTSPIWGPQEFLADDSRAEALFPRFPYDHVPGHLMIQEFTSPARRWAARLGVEYTDDFDRLKGVGGHLLVSTTSRWGVDGSMAWLDERLPGGRRDHLWLGDCNLVLRFAQSEWAEFRAGAGVNWLDDPGRTDLGVNFTYAADFFPRHPWVLSGTIDWGTLGRAELFRLRGTAGVIVNRFEVYAGYEYLDIDRTQRNALVAGVRIWY
jgi:hypothetical protein